MNLITNNTCGIRENENTKSLQWKCISQYTVPLQITEKVEENLNF